MPTFNIIGDIHGRDTWKRLVDEYCINIFVGITLTLMMKFIP